MTTTNVILIWTMFNTHFFNHIVYITGADSFLSSSQHYDIISSGVIMNPSILLECIGLATFLNISFTGYTFFFTLNEGGGGF